MEFIGIINTRRQVNIDSKCTLFYNSMQVEHYHSPKTHAGIIGEPAYYPVANQCLHSRLMVAIPWVALSKAAHDIQHTIPHYQTIICSVLPHVTVPLTVVVRWWVYGNLRRTSHNSVHT